jgi:uncharacterized protein
VLSHYRTASGNELDLVVDVGGWRTGIEIKFSSAPKVGKGFRHALHDLAAHRACVVAPVASAYPLARHVEVLPLHALHFEPPHGAAARRVPQWLPADAAA